MNANLLRRRRLTSSSKPARNHEQGFTLVELLVVLGILGLLVAIASPQVLKYLDRAKVSTTRVQIASLSTALNLFKLDVGRFPTTEEGLAALLTAPVGDETWNGPYINKTANLNDPWGRPYNYRAPGEHGEFDLSSQGPNSGGGGVAAGQLIANW